MEAIQKENPMDEKKRTRDFYDKGAKYYDFVCRFVGRFGFRKLRRQLISLATGQVLEVGFGTGLNLEYYPAGLQLTGVDLSSRTLAIARRRASKLCRLVNLQVMDTEELTFPDQSFDTVVSTLTVCGYPDPVKALSEIRRVTKASGKILLLEHGRSSNQHLAHWQDRRDAKHYQKRCCHLNCNPLALAKTAGLTVIKEKRFSLGILYWIEATP